MTTVPPRAGPTIRPQRPAFGVSLRGPQASAALAAEQKAFEESAVKLARIQELISRSVDAAELFDLLGELGIVQ